VVVRVSLVVEAAWVADRVGIVDALTKVADRALSRTSWTDVLRALLDKDFETAADLYEAIGLLDTEAYARLQAAEWLASEGRRTEADVQLKRALAFYRSVGATRYIREGEALLAAAS